MKKTPFYPFLIALFPVLALYNANIGDARIQYLFRPLLFSLIIGLIAFGILLAIFRKLHRAALVSTLVLLLFFTYGHVYYLLRSIPNIGLAIARNRYLIPLYIVLLAVGVWLLVWKVKDPARPCLTLNVFGILLVVIPTVTIAFNLVRNQTIENTDLDFSGYEQTIDQAVTVKPDIYYIILDTYTRQDALLDDYGFDNSEFLNQLTDMGFYVAECSRSNYYETQSSLSSSLNMVYKADVVKLAEQNHLQGSIHVFIKQSLVRAMLEKAGYQTVAFATTYPFTELTDADHYFTPIEGGLLTGYLSAFERLLLKTTALSAVTDLEAKIANSGSPYAYHINTELALLENLGNVPQIAGPKFVFAHIVLTHGPFVFLPDGTITSDPNYLNDEQHPITEEYKVLGYTNQIQYVNSRILEIVSKIIAGSETPPVIILQGDHGFEDQNRNSILNAYYVDPGLKEMLYPTITPVNSFRLIFNYYFHTNLDQVPDLAYSRESPTVPVEETSAECVGYYK